MQIVYEWIKNLVFFYILITAVLHILPKNSYQKYVRFFAGLLLVVLVLSPFLDFIKEPDFLLDKISYESFWQEMDSVKLDLKGMEKIQKQAYQKEYEKAIAEDVSFLATEQGLSVLEAKVTLTEDYRVGDLALSVLPGGREKGIYIEKITFQDNAQEYPGVLELKNKIMEFYKIEENQIRIHVREG